MSGEADSVAGIQIISEQIVKLELIQPVAFFLSTLCTEYSYIVPREEVERPAMEFEISTRGFGSVPRRRAGAWQRKYSLNGFRTIGIRSCLTSIGLASTSD